jgi:hypothetical protein
VPVAETCTAANGTYALAVGPGSYEVKFAGDPGPCGAQSSNAPEWFNSRFSRAFADPISVVDGQDNAAVDASLQDGGRIAGTVTAAGVPVKDVTVDLLDVSLKTELSACSGAAGTYALDPVAGGVYSVRFSPKGRCGDAGNYAVQWYDKSSTQAGARAVGLAGGEEVNGVDAALIAPSASPVASATATSSPRPTPTPTPGGSPVALDTKITRARIRARKGRARFAFVGNGAAFDCALTRRRARPPRFKPCASPRTYKHLRRGRYRFQVRTRDVLGRIDTSPARKRFRSRRVTR